MLPLSNVGSSNFSSIESWVNIRNKSSFRSNEEKNENSIRKEKFITEIDKPRSSLPFLKFNLKTEKQLNIDPSQKCKILPITQNIKKGNFGKDNEGESFERSIIQKLNNKESSHRKLNSNKSYFDEISKINDYMRYLKNENPDPFKSIFNSEQYLNLDKKNRERRRKAFIKYEKMNQELTHKKVNLKNVEIPNVIEDDSSLSNKNRNSDYLVPYQTNNLKRGKEIEELRPELTNLIDKILDKIRSLTDIVNNQRKIYLLMTGTVFKQYKKYEKYFLNCSKHSIKRNLTSNGIINLLEKSTLSLSCEILKEFSDISKILSEAILNFTNLNLYDKFSGIPGLLHLVQLEEFKLKTGNISSKFKFDSIDSFEFSFNHYQPFNHAENLEKTEIFPVMKSSLSPKNKLISKTLDKIVKNINWSTLK